MNGFALDRGVLVAAVAAAILYAALVLISAGPGLFFLFAALAIIGGLFALSAGKAGQNVRGPALLLTAAVMYLVAWYRGMPLLFAYAAAFISCASLAYAIPRLTLRKLSGGRWHPANCVEGAPVDIVLAVRNPGRFAIRLLEVYDALPPRLARNAPYAVLPRLPGGGERELGYRIANPLRGVYRIGPARAATGFPLGLVRAEADIEAADTWLWVYPRLFALETFPYSGETRRTWMRAISPHAGGEDDFAGVREYRHGDSPRHVHWRASARHGELIVREYQRVAATTLSVLIDLSAGSVHGEGGETTLEYAVRIAGSCVRHALAQGHAAQILGLAAEVRHGGPWRSVDDMEAVLRFLAALEADGATPFGPAASQLADAVPAHSTVLAVCGLREAEKWHAARNALQARGIACLEVLLDEATFSQLSASPGPAREAHVLRRGEDPAGLFRSQQPVGLSP